MTSQVTLRLDDMGLKVYTRTEWGAEYEHIYQSRIQNKPFGLPAECLFSHISVTRDDGPLTQDFIDDMRELERIGYQRFKSGISYNWAIDMVTGEIGEGMPLGAKGTHTVNIKGVKGFPENLNIFGHGIVAIGMPGQVPSTKFIQSFAAIKRIEEDLGFLVKHSPILPHSMFAYKDCPTQPIRNLLQVVAQTARGIGAMAEASKNTTIDLTQKIGDYKDPDGSPLTVGEALVRGNAAYWMKMDKWEEYKRANGQK